MSKAARCYQKHQVPAGEAGKKRRLVSEDPALPVGKRLGVFLTGYMSEYMQAAKKNIFTF